MVIFGLLSLIFIYLWYDFGKDKCTNCGSRNTVSMNYETGKYCNSCYKRFE